MKTTEEIWRVIPSFPRYEASSFGRIRSERKILKLVLKKKDKRLIVSVYRDGRYQLYVHVGVCEAFHGAKPDWARGALHKDDDPTNNTPGNLYWGTAKQNSADAKRNGKVANVRGEKHGMAKLSSNEVEEIRSRSLKGESGKTLAREYGVSGAMISLIINRKNWT